MVGVPGLVVVPEVVGRPGWDVEGAREDTELVWWIGRFRFVTVEAAAGRLGVSRQRAQARLQRLARRGLVGATRSHRAQPAAWYLTPAGSVLVGGERRRPPRADVQREHEAAIVELVAELEAEHPDAVVLTERECRRAERDQERRCSIELPGGVGLRHWPDVVLIDGEAIDAYEIELTPKSTPRLRAILGGYRDSDCRAVHYIAGTQLARRIARLAEREGLPLTHPGPWHQTVLRMHPQALHGSPGCEASVSLPNPRP